MTSAALTLAVPAGEGENPGGYGHVLDGVGLDGAAARLAALLDPGFLIEAGWDPGTRMLALPAGHRLLGRRACRVGGCLAKPLSRLPGVCYSCFNRLTRMGLSRAEIAEAELVPLPGPVTSCAVSGCRCVPTVSQAVLCEPHSRQFRGRVRKQTIDQFLADPRVRPLPPRQRCAVAACIRPADSACGYCNTHYQRWRIAARADPALDPRWWQAREPAVAEPGLVSLRGLPPLVVAEVLFGVWQRVRGGAKITDVDLRAVCDALRRHQVTTIAECQAGHVPSRPVRSLLNALARHVRRGLADPGSEQAKDIWDLAVFGHRGNLSFGSISQPWLRQATKRWAAEELPHHRGAGASKVRDKVNALGRLSESLRVRADHGLVPAVLGRADIENFLSRLGYLEWV